MKYKKVFLSVIIVIVALFILFVVFIMANNMAYNARYKKENSLVMLVDTEKGQRFFILGTIHTRHFEQTNNYSLADIQSVIETVKPDKLLLEYRQEVYENFTAVDGPAEMIFAYAYGVAHNIPVAGVDYWRIDENAQSNSTNDIRDDRIFTNSISGSDGDSTVLILLGRDHLEFQVERFLKAGCTKVKIDDIQSYFAKSDPDNFSYPPGMLEEIDNKALYFDLHIGEEIRMGISSDDEKRAEWEQNAANMVDYLINDLKPLVAEKSLFYP